MESRMKSVKIALYISLVLWFARKILDKLRGNYRTFRGSLRRFPGQPGYDLYFDTVFPMELGEMLSQVGRLNPAEQVRVEEKTLSQRRTCVWGLGGALGRTQQVEP